MHRFSKSRDCTELVSQTFCPLDLFSQNRNRVFKAISALKACPSNNFKMFLGGDPLNSVSVICPTPILRAILNFFYVEFLE
jgi:hypothetical protein